MAWTITYDPTAPRVQQLADVEGLTPIFAKCDISGFGQDTPIVKGYLYDAGATPESDPPGSADQLEDDGSGATFKGTVNVQTGTSGGYAKPNLTDLTLRVWAGRENQGQWETMATKDRTVCGCKIDHSTG